MSELRSRARLLCRSGKLAGRTFQLGDETRIGRDPANDVVLDIPSVSKTHARIVYEDGRYLLEDLDSTHGTRLDGVAIEAPTPLSRLHVIEVSDVELVFTPASSRGSPTAKDSSSGASRSDESAGADPEPPNGPASHADAGSTMVDAGGTMVDAGGFGTLPDLDREAGSPDSGGKRDDPDSGGKRDDPGGSGTIVDSGGFGALPELESESAEPEEPEEPDESPTRYEITVDLPDGDLTTFPLTPGDNIVGRGEDCDITIVDPAMWLSRKHAILRVKEEGVELVDLKGVNGTFVDGKRIDTAMLAPGSTFMLGPHLEFKLKAR